MPELEPLLKLLIRLQALIHQKGEVLYLDTLLTLPHLHKSSQSMLRQSHLREVYTPLRRNPQRRKDFPQRGVCIDSMSGQQLGSSVYKHNLYGMTE